MAYVIDTLNRREDSYIIHTQPTSADAANSYLFHTPANIIHTQPMSADAANSYLFHTPANIGWKSGCANRDIRPEMIE